MTYMTKTDTFAGRVALITGAGQGIGRVFAKGFARAGAKIAIVELNEDSGRSVAAEVEAECGAGTVIAIRSEEHTSELQSLMRISDAVFCVKKKKRNSRSTH